MSRSLTVNNQRQFTTTESNNFVLGKSVLVTTRNNCQTPKDKKDLFTENDINFDAAIYCFARQQTQLKTRSVYHYQISVQMINNLKSVFTTDMFFRKLR